MSAITITVDDREVVAALNALRERTGNLRPALRAIGTEVRSGVLESMEQQRSPDGKAWPPLSAASIIARARRRAPAGFRRRRKSTIARFTQKAKALMDTGQLRNSIRVREVTTTSVTVGTPLAYAAIHHFGGRAGRGRKVTIPARPYMGLSPQARADVLEIIARHIAGGTA